MYKDAGGRYAYSSDSHTGSLPLPFETVLEKMGNADVWIMSYNGIMTRNKLHAEYSGYEALKPYKTGEIYGCPVDVVPYFEEVSWRRREPHARHVRGGQEEGAIHGHRQSSRDRGGCHHQHVGWGGVFLPQAGALCHTESMLFVDNRQSQIPVLHHIFQ